MIRTVAVQASGLSFDVDVAGEPGAPLVLLLHGFPQTSYSYRQVLPALAEAGFFAAAPNQRGYSPRARPPDVASYATSVLLEDALALAAKLGAQRFHLVGHDWGGQLAWLIAAAHPQRLLSLSVLSRPHPAAFAAAFSSDPGQAERSRHHSRFDDPNMAARLLEDDARRLRRMFTEQGVAAQDADAYVSALRDRAALDAALHWYRAARSGDRSLLTNVPAVRVPSLYLWGDADATVGRAAAEATAAHVTGPYDFQVLAGVGHFLTDQAGPQVTQRIVAHVSHGGT